MFLPTNNNIERFIFCLGTKAKTNQILRIKMTRDSFWDYIYLYFLDQIFLLYFKRYLWYLILYLDFMNTKGHVHRAKTCDH